MKTNDRIAFHIWVLVWSIIKKIYFNKIFENKEESKNYI